MKVRADIKEVKIILEDGKSITLSWDEFRDLEEAVKYIRTAQDLKRFDYIEAEF